MVIKKFENYQKAKAFLDDAKLLSEHKRFNSAISRAYYALYQFSIYILAQHGETRPKDNWTHNKMPKVLEQK
ncbi:HEPN domain-containing protein [Candidatus Albibeggiatoa sp. nov. BB20]|uniref:HEPN domain-containing protein n=1 Tax=Candidatus Albibeggiatoa sp. nov. BB20 TaxID=3162723 RepID=UPI003365A670